MRDVLVEKSSQHFTGGRQDICGRFLSILFLPDLAFVYTLSLHAVERLASIKGLTPSRMVGREREPYGRTGKMDEMLEALTKRRFPILESFV